MVRTLGARAAESQLRLAAVREWWHVRHPPPSLGQRLDLLYMAAMTLVLSVALAYGTASSALAEVVTPLSLAVFGPSIAMLAVLVTAHWGSYQGPVVFSVADVATLLGAPLPRRGLASRRLMISLATGCVAGAAAAGVVTVGLAGQGRHVTAAQAAGLTVGYTELAALAVAAAWAVQRSARFERFAQRATWPGVLVAAGLVAVADAGEVGRSAALWSGPWGWAVLPGTGGDTVESLAALAALTLTTAIAAAAAMRDSGGCPTERHMRRAVGRTSAIASLVSFDARTARRALEAVGPQASRRSVNAPGWLHAATVAGAARHTPTLAIVWRDSVAGLHAPGRVLGALALTAAGTVLCLLNADRPVAVAAAITLLYFGASRMLAPLRSELDLTARTRVLVTPRLGRVLLAHGVVAVVVAMLAAATAAVCSAMAGALPDHGAATVLALIALPATLAGCAAMSARRGGRMPQSLFVTAIAVDPSGGGLAIASWAVFWPTIAAILAGGPIILIGETGATLFPLAWIATTSAVLAYLVSREPRET